MSTAINLIMEGQNPSIQQIEEIIPQVKILEKIIDKVKSHIKDRLIEGDVIPGAKMVNGRKTKKVESALSSYQTIKAELGDKFDTQKWQQKLNISAKDLEDFYCSHFDPKEKKQRIEELKSMLAGVYVEKTGSPYMRLG